jgi:hypothetical protein
MSNIEPEYYLEAAEQRFSLKLSHTIDTVCHYGSLKIAVRIRQVSKCFESLLGEPFISMTSIILPFDNYVTSTLFSTWDHLKWKGFQVVFFSWAMHREAEHPSSTHAQNKFWILINKYGNKH